MDIPLAGQIATLVEISETLLLLSHSRRAGCTQNVLEGGPLGTISSRKPHFFVFQERCQGISEREQKERKEGLSAETTEVNVLSHYRNKRCNRLNGTMQCYPFSSIHFEFEGEEKKVVNVTNMCRLNVDYESKTPLHEPLKCIFKNLNFT